MPADVEPPLAGPAVAAAQHRAGKRCAVGAPVLPGAGADVTDGIQLRPVQPRHERRRRVEPVDVVHARVGHSRRAPAAGRTSARERRRLPGPRTGLAVVEQELRDRDGRDGASRDPEHGRLNEPSPGGCESWDPSLSYRHSRRSFDPRPIISRIAGAVTPLDRRCVGSRAPHDRRKETDERRRPERAPRTARAARDAEPARPAERHQLRAVRGAARGAARGRRRPLLPRRRRDRCRARLLRRRRPARLRGGAG